MSLATLHSLPPISHVRPSPAPPAAGCSCGASTCTGPWQLGCELGFDNMQLDADAFDPVYESPAISPEAEDDRPAAVASTQLQRLTRELETLREAMALERAQCRRVLLLAAHALMPYRRCSPSLLTPNDAALAFQSITELLEGKLGPGCFMQDLGLDHARSTVQS